MFRDPLALTRGYEDRPRPQSSRNDSASASARNEPKPAAPVNRYQSWAKVNQDRKDRE
jgi:hypothetical protein